MLITELRCVSRTESCACQRSKNPSWTSQSFTPVFGPSLSLFCPLDLVLELSFSLCLHHHGHYSYLDPTHCHLSEHFLGLLQWPPNWSIPTTLAPLNSFSMLQPKWAFNYIAPSKPFCRPFIIIANHHHNYTDSTFDQGLEIGWSYNLSFTWEERFWMWSGHHWKSHRDDVERRLVFALPARPCFQSFSLNLQNCLCFSLLCFPRLFAMFATTTGPLHVVLLEYWQLLIF